MQLISTLFLNDAEHNVDPNQDPISKYLEFEIFQLDELRRF